MPVNLEDHVRHDVDDVSVPSWFVPAWPGETIAPVNVFVLGLERGWIASAHPYGRS